jgi:hypothetical protein
MIGQFILGVFLFLGLGCESKEEAPVEPIAAPEPEKPKKTMVEGVPDLDMTMVPPKNYRKSVSNNNKGMKYYKKKDYSKANHYFILSLEEYPGNMLSRFNLACTFALNGNQDKALGILKQLKEAEDCLPCKERLLRSKKDKDFTSMWDTPEYKEVLDGVTVDLPDYKALAKKFIKNMGKGYWKEMVDAARAEEAYVVLDNGKDGWRDDDPTFPDTYITKKRDIEKLKSRWTFEEVGKPRYDPGSAYKYSLSCSKTGCCTVKPKLSKSSRTVKGVGDYGMHRFADGDRFMAGEIERVCFRAVSSEEAYVSAIYLNSNAFGD